MKNLIDLFASGSLHNKDNKPIILQLIPLEVENNKQYVSHLKQILGYNINSHNKHTRQNVIKAKNFLDINEESEDVWSKYLADDSEEQCKERIISWSPIYQPKRKSKRERKKLPISEILNNWNLYTKTRRKVLESFKEKKRVNMIRAVMFELRIQ
jgi:hypothetical protein